MARLNFVVNWKIRAFKSATILILTVKTPPTKLPNQYHENP